MNRMEMLELYESQDKKCAICKKEVAMFNGSAGGVIDHCHNSNDVRAILCQQCNIAVGNLENHDNIPALLEYVGHKL